MLTTIQHTAAKQTRCLRRSITSVASSSKSPSPPAVQAIPPDATPVYVTMSNLFRDIPLEERPVAALDPSVFAHPIRRDILYLCVNFYRDALRQGTANTKTRGEVAGSGAKIRPQKGSGRARLGDAQSPMLRGGGVAFGPKPRDFATDLPRKVRQMGMRVALSAKVQENALGIAESLEWHDVRTQPFSSRLRKLGWERTLLVSGAQEVPARLERVARNIKDVHVLPAAELHVYEMLRWPKLVLDVEAVQYLERLLSKNIPEEERIPMPSPPALRYSRMEAGKRKKISSPIVGVDDKRSREATSFVMFE